MKIPYIRIVEGVIVAIASYTFAIMFHVTTPLQIAIMFAILSPVITAFLPGGYK